MVDRTKFYQLHLSKLFTPVKSAPVLHFNTKPAKIAGSSYSLGVEVRGIEPLSKHNIQKLSTCLFPYYLSAMNRKRTNQSIA